MHETSTQERALRVNNVSSFVPRTELLGLVLCSLTLSTNYTTTTPISTSKQKLKLIQYIWFLLKLQH